MKISITMAKRVAYNFHGRFLSAKGSKRERSAPGGNEATPVSAVPKGMFILARVFTAQPQASRIGARLRSLSFSQANTMDGPDTAKMIPTNDIGICHHANRKNPVITEAIAVPMAPIANPIAAKIPANLATSKGWAIGASPFQQS